MTNNIRVRMSPPPHPMFSLTFLTAPHAKPNWSTTHPHQRRRERNSTCPQTLHYHRGTSRSRNTPNRQRGRPQERPPAPLCSQRGDHHRCQPQGRSQWTPFSPDIDTDPPLCRRPKRSSMERTRTLRQVSSVAGRPPSPRPLALNVSPSVLVVPPPSPSKLVSPLAAFSLLP